MYFMISSFTFFKFSIGVHVLEGKKKTEWNFLLDFISKTLVNI